MANHLCQAVIIQERDYIVAENVATKAERNHEIYVSAESLPQDQAENSALRRAVLNGEERKLECE